MMYLLVLSCTIVCADGPSDSSSVVVGSVLASLLVLALAAVVFLSFKFFTSGIVHCCLTLELIITRHALSIRHNFRQSLSIRRNFLLNPPYYFTVIFTFSVLRTL